MFINKFSEHRHGHSFTHCLWLISCYISTVATEPNSPQSLKYLLTVPWQKTLLTSDLWHHFHFLLNEPVIPRKAVLMSKHYWPQTPFWNGFLEVCGSLLPNWPLSFSFVQLLFRGLLLTTEDLAEVHSEWREHCWGSQGCPAFGVPNLFSPLRVGLTSASHFPTAGPGATSLQYRKSMAPWRWILITTGTSTLEAGTLASSPPKRDSHILHFPTHPSGSLLCLGLNFPPKFWGSRLQNFPIRFFPSQQQESIPTRGCQIIETSSMSFAFFNFHIAASLIFFPPYFLPFEFFFMPLTFGPIFFFSNKQKECKSREMWADVCSFSC